MELDREAKKKWLKRHRKNKRKLDRLKNKLLAIDEMITKTRSPNYSGMPRGGQGVTLEDLISDKLETENRINRLAQTDRKIKKEILEALDTLDDTRHLDVMEKYLIDCMEFDTVAEDTGYTLRHTMRLYREAVGLIKIPCHVNDTMLSLH